MNRKNIFLCVPTLINAGAQRFVTELACSINKDKYHVYVVVTGIYDTKDVFFQRLVNEGIDVIDATASNYIKQVIILIKYLRLYKPTIVHSNVSSAMHVIIPIALSGIKLKHLFTTHSMGDRIFTGLRKKVMKILFNKGIVIPVAICDIVKKSLEEAYDLSENKIECVYNGVNTQLFVKRLKKNDEEFTFVSVGTLYHIKNQELLIDAFARVKNEVDNVKLVLVGDGDMRNTLITKVDKLGLASHVFFAGNQTDVISFLSDADVYCCSSLVEGLPISVLEAMSCSLPIITTPAGGVVDIVKDGYNGYVVDYDPVLYSKKMLELVTNEEIRLKMALNSREYVEKFDISNCAKGYENLYKKYSNI